MDRFIGKDQFESLDFAVEGTMRNHFSRGSSKEPFDEHVMALLYAERPEIRA